jgi:16S rRNA (cytidine1402-2'-O)-methyltransferase
MMEAPLPAGLYLVGTPIGNLSDLSPRAARILAQVDFIAAEDTRRTLGLLNHLGVKKKLISYYEHNKRERGRVIADRIHNGERCALVTDAGMPAISDPGEDLVVLCHEEGIPVTCIPGPCAAVCALAVSGLPSGRFTFEGFLSTARKSRREHLQSLSAERRTMIFYEAPHKLLPTLKDLLAILGDREICIVREMTKIHEEIFKGTLSQALERWRDQPPKGEIVLLIRGVSEKKAGRAVDQISGEIAPPKLHAIMKAHREEGLSKSESLRSLAEKTGLSRNELYRRLQSEEDML